MQHVPWTCWNRSAAEWNGSAAVLPTSTRHVPANILKQISVEKTGVILSININYCTNKKVNVDVSIYKANHP